MAGDMGILGVHIRRQDIRILRQRINIGILQRHTWHIGKGANLKWHGQEEVEDINVGGAIRLNIHTRIHRLDRFHRSNILILHMVIRRPCIRQLHRRCRSLHKMS